MPDPKQLTETMLKVTQQSQAMFQQFLESSNLTDNTAKFNPMDPGVVGKTFGELTQKLLEDPSKAIEAQVQFWNQWAALTQESFNSNLARMRGEKVEPKKATDKRFKDDSWSENPVFEYIKDSYLLVSQHVMGVVDSVDGLDDHTMEKVNFYTRQYVDAMSPSNFALTNPVVMKETLETGGDNLIKGLNNLLKDLERGKGQLRISMTDTDAFELGKNVAVTPGKVVYQNDLMQLLQFDPSTEEVFKRPLLIVPPWINKYYILDLRAKNSFIKWAVDEGHTVFVISWVNPDESLANKNFEDYMLEGPLDAIEQIKKATGHDSVKAAGYCLGGTLLASTLAYLAAKDDDSIKAATFFTTMTDFSEPGELGVFIDDEQISLVENEMNEKGYLDGANMAQVFNMLRANDLIWSFVINNYLMGKDPFPFDLLYWNSDSTRMPRDMHQFYLRNMYIENKLVEPGGVTLNGVAIDLSKIKTPCYFLSTREDHIAPWKSTYIGAKKFGGPVRFVLGGSGHIAGVINPANSAKYGYCISKTMPETSDKWLEGAEEFEGSWWNDWRKWVSRYNGGKKVPARQPGEGLTVLEDAPGSYVKNRIT